MKKIKIFLTLALLLIIASSCESFLDVNEDPNNPIDVSSDLKLPVALNYTNNVLNARTSTNSLGNLMMANWSQSDGYSWYLTEFQYNVTPSFYSGIWDTSYGSALKQYNTMDTDAENNEYYQAIAKIMKAYHFQILVDTYGDIPYSEALKRGANTTPAYDDALSIYEDLTVFANFFHSAMFPAYTPSSEPGIITFTLELPELIKLIASSNFTIKSSYILKASS